MRSSYFPTLSAVHSNSDDKGKRGRKGWKTVGCPFLAFRPPSKEPCGIRKYPGGVFSRKAVADLFGQVMNGERKIRRLWAALKTIFWLIFPCGRRENQKEIPRSAERGQPARLDRAGPRARTRSRPLILFALGARTRIVTYGLWAGCLFPYFRKINLVKSLFAPRISMVSSSWNT